VKPGNILGGFNYYRANLCTTCAAWTPLDLTITDVPMTFLSGMGDTVVRSTWTDRVAAWYNNYTIEYVSDGGHFLMVEKPEPVVDRIRKAFLRQDEKPPLVFGRDRYGVAVTRGRPLTPAARGRLLLVEPGFPAETS
jgi:hypothetical protein